MSAMSEMKSSLRWMRDGSVLSWYSTEGVGLRFDKSEPMTELTRCLGRALWLVESSFAPLSPEAEKTLGAGMTEVSLGPRVRTVLRTFSSVGTIVQQSEQLEACSSITQVQ